MSYADPYGLDKSLTAQQRDAYRYAMDQYRAKKDFQKYQELCLLSGGANCDAPQQGPFNESSSFIGDACEILGAAVGLYGAGRVPALKPPLSTPLAARFGSQARLNDHFQRHGAEFGARNAGEYQRQASDFLTGSRGANTLQKIRANGDLVRFNQSTNQFGVLSRDGVIRTYYRPNPSVHGRPTNLDYYNGQ